MTHCKLLDTFLFIIEPKALVVCYLRDNTCFGNVVLTCYFKYFEIEITTDRDVGSISFAEFKDGNLEEYSWEKIYKGITSKENVCDFEAKINWVRNNIDLIIAYFDKKSKGKVIGVINYSEQIDKFLRIIKDFRGHFKKD